MKKSIKDKGFQLLVSAAEYIKKEHTKEKSQWNKSKFKWILDLPSGTKGSIGKQLVLQWCVLNSLTVDKSPDSEADCRINGHRIEIKFSTLWKSGEYRFQQIRDQNYEYVICLGISPFEAHCWIISKEKLKANVIGHKGQHTGEKGKETAWFPVNPQNPPDWLCGCGGTLEQAISVLQRIKRIT